MNTQGMQKCNAPAAIVGGYNEDRNVKFHEIMGMSNHRFDQLAAHMDVCIKQFQKEESKQSAWDLILNATAECKTPNEITYVACKIGMKLNEMEMEGRVCETHPDDQEEEDSVLEMLLEIMTRGQIREQDFKRQPYQNKSKWEQRVEEAEKQRKNQAQERMKKGDVDL